MRFQKRTIFAAAIVVIIAVAVAAVLFAWKPETENTADGANIAGRTDGADTSNIEDTLNKEDIAGTVSAGSAESADILKGDASFLYVSDGTARLETIDGVPALFDPEDAYMKIWSFAVQDLDGDGTDEIILSVYGMTGDTGGSLILHWMDGRAYGYTAGYREMESLKTDGTFTYSDPAGVVESGICTISGFTETGYTIDKITYGNGSYEGWDTFIVDREPATEEEFTAEMDRQRQKEDVQMYDFAEVNDGYN